MLDGFTYVPVELKSDIESPNKPKPSPLEPQYQVQIKIIQGYISCRIDIRQPIDDDFNNITSRQINEYRVPMNTKSTSSQVFHHNTNTTFHPLQKILHSLPSKEV